MRADALIYLLIHYFTVVSLVCVLVKDKRPKAHSYGAFRNFLSPILIVLYSAFLGLSRILINVLQLLFCCFH